jgi:hypothetical protein
MVQAHFKNEQRENPKENFEHDHEGEIPKIQMDPTDW